MPTLFAAVLVIMGSFAMLLPSIIYVLSNMGLSSSLSTLILAAYSMAQFLAGPRWGRLSDLIGRKQALLYALTGSAVSYGLMAAFADSVWALFITMTLAGVYAGALAVVFAAVSDITTTENRTKGMGVIGAGIGLAFVLGTAVGGSISGGSAETASLVGPAGAASIAAALGLLFLYWRMTETLSPEIREANASVSDTPAPTLLSRLQNNGHLAKLSLLIFFFTLCLAMMEPLIPPYVRYHFDWGPKEMRNIFLYVGVILILVQGGLVGRLARKWGEQKLAKLGLVFMMIGLLGLALFPEVMPMMASLTFTSIGGAFFSAATLSLASLLSDKEVRGATMGVAQSMQALGRSFGPLVAGVLFDIRTDIPFWTASIVVFILLITFMSQQRSQT